MRAVPRFDLAVRRVNPDDELFYAGLDLPVDFYDNAGDYTHTMIFENCTVTSWEQHIPEDQGVTYERVVFNEDAT